MRQQLESQRIEIDVLRTRLDKLTENIWLLFEIYMKKNMKEWRSSNNGVCDLLIKRHIDDAIVEITEAEGMSVCRYTMMSIENIMAYTPSEWLSKRSQVIVKFVDTDSEQWRR